jgi:hypothetical protein
MCANDDPASASRSDAVTRAILVILLVAALTALAIGTIRDTPTEIASSIRVERRTDDRGRCWLDYHAADERGREMRWADPC